MKEKIKFFLFILLLGFLLTFFLTGSTFFSDQYLSPWADSIFNHWMLHYNYKAVTNNFFLTPEYFNSPQFYPFPGTLAMADNIIFPSLTIYSPLFLITKNSTLSYNLFILLSFVITFVSTFYSINFLLKNKISSLFSSIIYTFPPMIFARFFSGHIEYLNRYFIPPLIVSSIFFFEKPNFKRGLLLSSLFFLSWLTNIQLTIFSSLFVFIFFIYFFWIHFRSHKLKLWLKNVSKSSIFIIPFLAIIYLLYLPHLQFSIKEDISRSIEEVTYYSGSVWNLLMPNLENNLFGNIFKNYYNYKKAEYAEFILFPGLIPFLIFFLSILFWNKKDKYHPLFIFNFFIGCLLILGPFLLINGLEFNSLYYYLYHFFLPLRAIRTPTRVMIVAFLFFSLSIGFFIKKITQHKVLLAKLIIGLFLISLVMEYKQNLKITTLPRQDFLSYDLTGKKILFLPFSNDYDRIAYYLFGSLENDFTMVNGFIGTKMDDYISLKNNIDQYAFTKKWINRINVLDIDYIVLDLNRIHKRSLQKLKISQLKNSITFQDNNWIVLNLKKIPVNDCINNNINNLTLKVLGARKVQDSFVIYFEFENISSCNLRFIYEDRYFPIAYQVITSKKTLNYSKHIQFFPYLLKGEKAVIKAKLPINFEEKQIKKLMINFNKKEYIYKL